MKYVAGSRLRPQGRDPLWLKMPLHSWLIFVASTTHLHERHPTMAIIGTIIIGLIVGFLARALKPGNDSLGWVMTAVLGIAGSFLASYAGSAMGWYQPGEVAGFIASIVGAVVLLVIYGLVASKK